MAERVDDMDATVEDIRLGIIENLIERYLSNELDLRQFSDCVTISRLHYSWPRNYSGGRLRELSYHHLFMFSRGDWPESSLRESLRYLLNNALEGSDEINTVMMTDRQCNSLLKAGHVPPGVVFFEHTHESLARMTREERRALFKRIGKGR